MFTGYYDKNKTPIQDTDKLIDKYGDEYVIWFEGGICNDWLICGGFLSGDDPSCYVDDLEVI